MMGEKSVNLALDEAGIKVASNATREPPCVEEESPESLDDALGSLRLEAVVHERQTIVVPPWRGAIAVANVHADGVQGVGGAFEELAPVPALDGSDVAESSSCRCTEC